MPTNRQLPQAALDQCACGVTEKQRSFVFGIGLWFGPQVLVVGDSGLGKTTLVKTLLSTPGERLQVGVTGRAGMASRQADRQADRQVGGQATGQHRQAHRQAGVSDRQTSEQPTDRQMSTLAVNGPACRQASRQMRQAVEQAGSQPLAHTAQVWLTLLLMCIHVCLRTLVAAGS